MPLWPTALASCPSRRPLTLLRFRNKATSLVPINKLQVRTPRGISVGMNRRNAEALRQLLEQAPSKTVCTEDAVGVLAGWLATQGVLVPASLSNEQICEWDGHESGIILPEWLERVAQGEDDPL